MSCKGPVLFLTLALAGAGFLAAQEGPFTDEVSVHLVTVEVNVETLGGEPIAGLSADDFAVFEDGELRPIRFFEEVVRPRAGATGGSSATGAPAAAAPVEATARATEPVYVLLGFDFENLPIPEMSRAVRAAKEFVRESASDDVLWSLLILGSNTHAVTDLTSDVDTILEGLDKMLELRRGRLVETWGLGSFLDTKGLIDSSFAPAGAGAGESSEEEAVSASLRRAQTPAGGRSLEDFLQSVEKCRIGNAARAAPGIREVLKTLATAAGRKALVLYYAARDAVAPPHLSADCINTMAKVSRLWQDTARAANSLGFQVYGNDVSGLNQRDADFLEAARERRTEPGTNPELVGENLGGMTLFQIEDAASLLAGLTGGRDVRSNELDLALENALDDLGTFYRILYEVSRGHDGEEHQVKVELAGERLANLRYRRSYVDLSRRQFLLEQLAASSNLPKAGGSFPIDLAIEVGEPEKGHRSVTAILSAPVASLGMTTVESGGKKGAVEAFLVLHGADGTILHREQVPHRLEAPPGSSLEGALFRQAWRFRLPRGTYTMTGAVYNATDDTASVVAERVDL